MIIVSAQQMRELDRLTIQKYGTPSLVLMERAGECVAEAILDRYSAAALRGVLVVAGKGNNGGDGFVVARVLKERGIPCEVALLAGDGELAPDAAHNRRVFENARGAVARITADSLSGAFAGRGLLVDAILGTGIRSEVRGPLADGIVAMNASGLPIVAVDIPSGLDTDRGVPLGAAIQAEMTVALGFAKLGEVIHPGVEHVGELVVADIGIDPRAVAEVAPSTEMSTEEEAGWLVPRRRSDSHKGSYGHLLAVAGARGKTGAAVLACRAAMRTGSGLVTLAAPRSLNDILAGSLVEVMTELLDESAAGEIQSIRAAHWSALLERKNVVLFGPGIGVNDATRDALRWLLRHLEVPWVIDADGLNNLALDVDRLKSARSAPVLTPHPGEMARLIGKSTAAVNEDRIGIAREFATVHRCHLVLKGARSVIATAAGRVIVNPTGNPGMASGGMGDVLAGIVASLLGQGLGPEHAMKLGVFLHGFVADRIAAARGEIGLIASDVIDGLPEGIRELSAAASQARNLF